MKQRANGVKTEGVCDYAHFLYVSGSNAIAHFAWQNVRIILSGV